MTYYTDPILVSGIKTVAVGKKGSKSLDSQQVSAIMKIWGNENLSPAGKGAFIGALLIKGATDEERKIEELFGKNAFADRRLVVESLEKNAPEEIKKICVELLENKTLSEQGAEFLGDFLLSETPGDALRGLAASVLRVRYETAEEYRGILKSIHKTVSENFHGAVPQGKPIVQIAEPFDGVDHSNLITPLIAHSLQEAYRVVSLVGRNSGPKFGNNLNDLAKALTANYLKASEQLSDQKVSYGWYLHQKDISAAVDRWVDIRRQVIKRPFMATLERFINPLKADICIASAFHPPYGEKMLQAAEDAGFNGVIIVRNGLEGTLAFALKRYVRILCSARRKDRSFTRHELILEPKNFIDFDPPVEEKLTEPSLEKNKELIENYLREGRSGYDLFDARVQFTTEGLKRALDWIKENLKCG